MPMYPSSFVGWRRNESGTIAVYAALTMTFLFAMLGFGLDYWTTLSMKARLDAAADAAALAGVKAASIYVTKNPDNRTGQDLTDHATVVGEQAAKQTFYANASAVPQVAGSGITAKFPTRYISSDRGFHTDVTYSAERPMAFASLVGFKSLPLANSVSAEQKQSTYLNIYVIVDTSQSMGIGANATEMTKLYNVTAPLGADGPNIGCVFGCHRRVPGAADSLENVAHRNNIKLRIDIAREAIYNMAQIAKTNITDGSVKFSVQSMSLSDDGLRIRPAYPSSGVTNDYTQLMQQMSPTSPTLDMEANLSTSADSNMDLSLADFANTLPRSGDGASANSPLIYVYIITDGLNDTDGTCSGYGHCTWPLDNVRCAGLKDKGAKVGTVYTTYVPIYTRNDPKLGLDDRYVVLAKPHVDAIPLKLQACSSGAGWYYEASDDVALKNAVNKLFRTTVDMMHLVN